jgi:hypothetical protein
MGGHIACVGEMKNAYNFWSEYLKGSYYSEDLGVDVRIILEWMLGK